MPKVFHFGKLGALWHATGTKYYISGKDVRAETRRYPRSLAKPVVDFSPLTSGYVLEFFALCATKENMCAADLILVG